MSPQPNANEAESATADAAARPDEHDDIDDVDGHGFVLGDDDLHTAHPLVRGAIVVVTALSVVAVANAHRTNPLTAVLLTAMVVVLGALSFVDVAEQRLPNRITYPLAAATTAIVLVAGIVESRIGDAFGAIGVGLLFSIVLLVMRFGMGDVKMVLPIGTVAGWFGVSAVVGTIMIASLSGAIVALALLAVYRRRSLTFGFGPFLALGSVAGMLAAAPT